MRKEKEKERRGEERTPYIRNLVIKPEGRRSLGRPRRRWEDITIDRRETGWELGGWIGLGPVNGSCEHGNEPSGFIQC
jgi:hypothetical protein